jgi:hypothetical protein
MQASNSPFNLARMRTLTLGFVGCVSLLMLPGCHHHGHLDTAKKERLVSELVSTAPQCNAYLEMLRNPDIEDDDVDDIYHKAMSAHCLKKDV